MLNPLPGNWMVLALALAAVAAPASAAPEPKACEMQPTDRQWIDSALDDWRYAERHFLKLENAPLPTIVAIDQHCTYVSRPRSGSRPAWRGTPHEGTITLPDGKQAPAGIMSFAAPAGQNSGEGYFAMSLPSVWEAGGVTSELGLKTLMRGVLLHELMHTRQFYFANPTIARLTARYGLADDINDDSLQDAFKGDPDYVRAYERERDLLYAAAAAPNEEESRRLAGQALGALRERRGRWFTGQAEKWAPLDEIFLTMEGLGQWIAYKGFVAGTGRTWAPDIALTGVRRAKGQWSQDEGLALFLVIDRLVPDWQKHAFAAEPETAEALLARAAR